MTSRIAFFCAALLLPVPAFAAYRLVPGPVVPALNGITSEKVVDFDGDGDLDLLVGSLNANEVHWLRNNGSGAIVDTLLLGGLLAPTSVETGDFDGDGDPDLAVSQTQFQQARLSAWKNGGAGSLVGPDDYTVPQYPTGVVTRDFDGDGILDLVVNCPGRMGSSGAFFQLYKGAGNGTFTTWTRLDASFKPPVLLVGDLDGDGRPDLVCADPSFYSPPGYVYGYRNTPTGFEFIDGPRIGVDVEDDVLLDLDGDGDLDLAAVYTNQTIETLLNDGAAHFGTRRPYRVGAGPHVLAVADLDLDGRPELVVSNSAAGTVQTFHNEGNGYFTRATTNTVGAGINRIAAGDFDGDGRPDIAVLKSNSATILFNQSAPPPSQASCAGGTVATADAPAQPVARDLDGDGLLDIATVNASGSISIFPGGMNGTLGPRQDVAVAPGASSIAVGDVTGDGVPDFAIARPDTDAVDFYRNDGAFHFTRWRTLPTGDHPVYVVLADLNGDGLADLATVNAYVSFGGGVTVRLQPSDSNWNPAASAAELATPSNGTMLSVGDLNNDGKKDLAVSFESGPVDRIFAVSPGAFGSGSLLSGFTGRWNVVGDFDGDGKDDLACVDRAAGLVRSLMYGGTPDTTVVGPLPNGIVPASIDTDGRADLVFVREDGFVGSLFGGPVLTWGPTCTTAAGMRALVAGIAPGVGAVAWLVQPDSDALWSRSFLDDSFLVLVGAPDSPASPLGDGGVLLERAAPNPASRPGPVRFALAQAGAVRLEVFDVRGRSIRVLENDVLPAGSHQRGWDGMDARGQRAAPGLYFYRLVAQGAVRVERQVLVEP